MASVKIIGKVAVKVMPDTTDFKQDLKSDLNRIEREIGDLKVDVIPQIDKAQKDKVKAEFDALAKSLDGRDLTFDLNLNEADAAEIEAALDALARNRTARVDIEYDRTALRQFGDQLLMLGGARPQIDGIREALRQLGRMDYVAINVGILATKMDQFAAAAFAATGHTLSLAGNLAKIGPAGLALPGILGGITVGLGATIAAFLDFNKYVPQAGDYMSRLQNVISSNFWDRAAVRINDFIDAVFPILLRNLAETGTALGQFFGRFAAALGTTLNPGLDAMFEGLNKSIEISSRYVDSFAEIIRILGETGAGYLPSLAKWFGEISEKFANFLSKAEQDGSLNRWINEGVDSLQALGNVIKNTSTIFYGLYTAARDAGGATLQSLAEDLGRISDTVNSSGFQKGLTEVFSASYQAMRNLTTGAGPGLEAMLLNLKDVFVQVTPAMGDAIGSFLGSLGNALADPSVGNALLTVFDGIQTAISNLAPTIGPVVAMFASFAPVIAALLDAITAFSAQGIEKLSPTIQGLAGALVPVINKMSDLFLTVGDDLTPVFQLMGENITRIVQNIGPLIDAIKDLWNMLSPVLVPVLKIVVGILGDAFIGVIDGVRWVIEGLTQVIGGVVDVFTGLWDVIAGLFSGDFSRVWDGLKTAFGGVGDIVMGALKAALGAVWAYLNAQILSIFKGAAMRLLGPILRILSPIGRAFGAAFNAAKPFFNWIVKGSEDGVKALTGPWGRIKDVIVYPFQRAMDLIRPIFNVVKTIVTTYFKVIWKIISTYVKVWVTIFKAVFKVIKVVVQTAWSVIKTVFVTYFSIIFKVVKTVWNAVRDFFTTTLNGIYFAFKGYWDDIAEFLIGAFNTIRATAKLVWGSIRDFIQVAVVKMRVRIEDVWNAIKSVTKAVWGAIKGFFVGFWQALKTTFQVYTGFVKAVVLKVWEAIRWWTNFYWTKVKAVITGVWDKIKGFVQGATQRVRDIVTGIWDAIRNKTGNTWDDIRSKITGAWDAIRSKVSDMTDRIKAIMSDAWNTIKGAVAEAWDLVKTKVIDKIGEIITKVAEMPGKVKAALGDLKTFLLASGVALIQGFIDGIVAKFKDAKRVTEDKLQELRDLFPFSPAKEGPFSGRGYTTYSGAALIDGFKQGIESQFTSVYSSLDTFMADISKVFDKADYSVSLSADASEIAQATALAAKVSAAMPDPTSNEANRATVQIDNITIPLEDLEQLKTLEDFLDMLSVRTRQGVIA